MPKYFVSMSSTFSAFAEGKVTLEDMTVGHFLFGPHKETLKNEGVATAFALAHNKEKPAYEPEAQYVGNDSLDAPVKEVWLRFRTLCKDAEKEGRIHWGDGKNYPGKIKPLLQQSNEVYWSGRWCRFEDFTYVGGE